MESITVIKSMCNPRIYRAWSMLKWSYGLAAIAIGLDKFFNMVTFWPYYVSPTIANFVPLSTPHLLYLIGVVEIVAGLIILSKWTRLGAYIVAAWIGVVVVNLLLTGKYYDIIVRDILLIVGAIVLAILSEEIADSCKRSAKKETVSSVGTF